MMPQFKLLPNWRDIAKRAWSVRLIALACALSGAEVAVQFISPDALPTGVLPALSGLVTAAALLARLLAQNPKDDDAKTAKP